MLCTIYRYLFISARYLLFLLLCAVGDISVHDRDASLVFSGVLVGLFIACIPLPHTLHSNLHSKASPCSRCSRRRHFFLHRYSLQSFSSRRNKNGQD
ncbi:hypothetical protein L218DRAFT_280095 [Marasmius fiardii PR-910]|nr:hypothetical protein L218DRAFT_280095 [Marasmius fiardii PR-910]